MPTFSELIAINDRTTQEDNLLVEQAQNIEGLLYDLEQLLQRSAPAGRIYFDKLGMHIRAGTSDTRRPEIQFIAGGKGAGSTGRIAGYSITDNKAGIYSTVNGFFDGTNWNIDDTAINGAIYNQGTSTTAHQWRYLPLGSNPITPVILLTLFNDEGGFVWNDEGGDRDFRVEGDTVTDLLKVDAGNEQVSVGGFFNLKDVGELTIASGVVTATGSRHTIDTESDDATDDLNTISGGNDGDILVLGSADNGRDPTLKDAADNLRLVGDFTLSNVEDKIVLIKRLTTWNELSRSDNT